MHSSFITDDHRRSNLTDTLGHARTPGVNELGATLIPSLPLPTKSTKETLSTIESSTNSQYDATTEESIGDCRKR